MNCDAILEEIKGLEERVDELKCQVLKAQIQELKAENEKLLAEQKLKEKIGDIFNPRYEGMNYAK